MFLFGDVYGHTVNIQTYEHREDRQVALLTFKFKDIHYVLSSRKFWIKSC